MRAITLRAPDEGPGGDALPLAEPGAHLRIILPGDYDDRHYSLVDLGESGFYTLGVRLEDHSRGGSRFMHNLTGGDLIWVEGPRQSFPLADDDRPALLIAGGIGITPLASMAAAMARDGRAFRLHYAGRSHGQLAFLPRLRDQCGDRLRVHADDDPQTRLDLHAAIQDADPAGHLYVCGPAGMIEAAREIAIERGFAHERIHSELFQAAPAADEARPFEIEVASTGAVLRVGETQSALDALEDAGLEPEHDCRRGGCGMCRAGVLSGAIDHRDVILTRKERERGDVMQLCVSRAAPCDDGAMPRLVLDL
ncbi:MAG: PDR/VanB family oxidoreductase [Pseudomonadota bacterium]